MSVRYKILIAEDDEDIVSLLNLYLETSGYQVICTRNGIEALQILENEPVDLAVLDIMMPQMDGYELTKQIRAISNIPIIIISAKGHDNDKIIGLNLGADDYISKPFNPMELVARVSSNLRRFYKLGAHPSFSDEPQLIEEGELCLDLKNFLLTKNKVPVVLTPMEYRLIFKMMQSPGRVFAKAQLYESVNGEYFDNDESTMMVHISNLREKIEDNPKNPKYIKTIRGIGYKFEVQK